ncbi:MAG TPA: hypothetical protein VHT21_23485 [Stellaceae bacterium]|jgi:hypothetical protein|nr:hypothetical protein [Stellaceae bacterium]
MRRLEVSVKKTALSRYTVRCSFMQEQVQALVPHPARERFSIAFNATKTAATVFRYADDAELQGKKHQERGSGRTRPAA